MDSKNPKIYTIINQIIPYAIQVIVKIFALSLGIFTTRWTNIEFNTNDRAALEIVFSISAIILAMTSLGFPNLLYKTYINKDKNLSDYWATINSLKIIFYFISIPVVVILGTIFKVTDFYLLIGVFTAQYILATDLHFKSVSDTNGRALYYSVSDLIGKIISILALYIGIVIVPHAVTVYIWAFIIANVITITFDAYFQKDFTNWGKLRLDYIKSDLKDIFIFFLSNIIMTSYLKTIPLFLMNYDANTIASYGNSQKIFDLWCVFPAIIIPVLVSKMAAKIAIDPSNKLRRSMIINKYALLVGGFACGLFAISIFTAPLVINIIGSNKFTYTGEIFNIQAVSLLVFPFLYFFGNYFLVINKIKYELFIAVCVAIISLLLITSLGRLYGYKGFILGLTSAYFTEFILKVILYIRNKNIKTT
jgi:O-antigen/teichoic acid export membrane protein